MLISFRLNCTQNIKTDMYRKLRYPRKLSVFLKTSMIVILRSYDCILGSSNWIWYLFD